MKKFTKIMAGTVLLSMALGMTGCSSEGKFTQKKFEKVALEDLEAEQYEFDDIDFDDPEEFAADLVADLEDGIYITVTGEEIMDSDFYDEDIMDIAYALMDIDFDYEDLDSNSTYMRAEVEDEDDFYVILGQVTEFKDKESAKKYYASSMNNIERAIKVANAVCGSELSLDELDKDYYKYNGGNSGHLVLKISLSDIDVEELDDLDIDATLVVGTYIEGKDILTVICICADSEGNDAIADFYDLLGVNNPYEFEDDDMLIDFINDIVKHGDKILERWMKKAEKYESIVEDLDY